MERQARTNRRLRRQLVVIGAALVVALTGGFVALDQRGEAVDERRIAYARELSTAALADLGIDPERAVLLALEAVELAGSTDPLTERDAVEALHRAVTTSRIERRVPGVGGAVEWSPAGDVFVAAGPSGSGIVELRDGVTGTAVRAFEGHEGDVTGVAFGHRGTLVATTGDDGVARVWDSATAEELHALRGSDGSSARSPAFSEDGRLFAAAWPDEGGGLVRILRLSTGELVQEIRSVARARSISFDPSGTKLAVVSEGDPTGVVVDLESGAPTMSLEGHLHGLTDVAWSPDGRSIATASYDGSARVFDAGSGRPNAVLSSHVSHVFAVDWNSTSDRLATASADGTAKVWVMIGGGREVMSLSAHDTRSGVGGVSFSPDGTRLVTGDVGRAGAFIWDVSISGGAEVGNVPALAFFYSAAAFTGDGRHLLTTGAGGTVSIWDARTLSPVRSLGVPPPGSHPGVARVSIGSPDDQFRIVPSDDGRLVATIRSGSDGAGIHDGTVQVWDARTGRKVFDTRVGSWANDASWSPAGQHLAIAGGDAQSGSITIVDRAGAHVRDIVLPGRRVDSARFSPDGERLVSTVEALGGYDAAAGQLQVWDWRRGEAQLTVDTESWLAVVSPAADVVATSPHPGAAVQDVTVWDIDTGETVATLRGHTGGVLDLSFSPDGSQLATAGSDGTTRLWNAATGEELLVLSGHLGMVSSVAFNVDGSRLATAGADGTVRVWAIELEELIDIARNRLTRDFTDEECLALLHKATCGSSRRVGL
jgi:WD40 repeat protein